MTPTSRPPIPSFRESTFRGPAIRGSTCRPAPDWDWDRPTRSSWLPSPTRHLQTSKAPPARPSKPKPSLAATPPPAVKKGEKDIFDDTDFEVDVPSGDSDSSDDKTVQLEAASDFDLEDSDTGSEVFAIDEEAVDQNASTAMAPSAFAEDDEDEEDDGFDSAVSSEMSAGWSSSSLRPVRSARPGDGAFPRNRNRVERTLGRHAGRHDFFLFLASFVAMDMVRNLAEFQAGGTMGSGLVRMIAGMFGG